MTYHACTAPTRNTSAMSKTLKLDSAVCNRPTNAASLYQKAMAAGEEGTKISSTCAVDSSEAWSASMVLS